MAAKEAGLEPGDVLLSWHRIESPVTSRCPSAGKLALPFDLVEVFLEQVPRGAVVLEGRRGAGMMSWVLPGRAPSDWQAVRVAPVLSGKLLDRYQEGRAALQSEEFEAGIASMRSAAAEAGASGFHDLAAWFLSEAARSLGWVDRWGEADALYGEALSLPISSERKSIVTAQLLREWGELFRARLSWARAKDCFERALAADRQKSFESLSAAWSLTGLGYVYNRSRGSQRDGQPFEKATAIRHRLAAGSSDDAASWFHWGNAAVADGENQIAIDRYERAIRILEGLETGGLLLVETLSSLALVRLQQGETDLAERTWSRAYSLVNQIAPDDFLVAGITQGLGPLAESRGDPARAKALLTRSLEVCRRNEPDSLYEAEALRELGQLEIRLREDETGSRHLCRAMELVESWRRKFQTNDEVRTRWGLRFSRYYHDCADSLLATGRAENAFLAIEKGRARGFLELRAERTLRQATPSSDWSLEWADLNTEYDHVQDQLGKISSRKGSRLEDIVSLEGRLREIRRRKERILEQRRPPGSVRYPEPLSLPEALQRLEPGTALLSYSVGTTRTLLFVLFREKDGAPSWKVLPLEVKSSDLRKRIGIFRDAIFKSRANRKDLTAQSRALYDLLIRPAEPYLANCDRIVLSPDGPLNTLPFAALLREDRYLIEWKPIHFVLSASVYADLLTQRRPAEERPASKLVAFGDAAYSRPDALVKRLPVTRKEVEEIGNLFPGAEVFLGEDVTEERVKVAVRGASLIHFAVHGFLDERNPLNSALILSSSRKVGNGRNNGLLQAWEVMEELPLDADLVTLSACDTALGQEIGGEGLIGLTRAFQYAGARSVLATLWGISDRSTSDFMVRLYGALRAGEAKDEALRSAQIAQIHSAKAQPFYWAAFQLYGDWR
ncbi:MAG TPA: CHAT domain-containing tetratricopeptide repeat protein [Thermoanaerobaculia bacterium]|nr:CHAT domain-containing tetratricopeptide repeat protein [Thermoanaerobaculia bacterium]